MISEQTFGNPVIDPSSEKSGLLGRQSNPELSEPSECWEMAGQKKRESNIHTKSSHCSTWVENGTKMKTEKAHGKA